MLGIDAVIEDDKRIDISIDCVSRGGDRVTVEVSYEGDFIGKYESNMKGPSKFTKLEDEEAKKSAEEYLEGYGKVKGLLGFDEVTLDLPLFVESKIDLMVA